MRTSLTPLAHRPARVLVLLTLTAIAFTTPLGNCAARAADAKPAAVASDPDIDEAARLMDDYHGETSQLQRARALLDAARERDPNSARLYRHYAELEIHSAMRTSNDYDAAGLARAQAMLDRAIELDPANPQAFVQRAGVLMLQDRLDDVPGTVDHAETLGAVPARVALLRAELLQRRGRYADAVPFCKAARDPENVNAVDSCLMDSYTPLRRWDDVDALHRAIIKREPTLAWARGNYATFLLCRRDRADAAAAQARDALALMDYGLARRALAAALYRQWADAASRGERAAADRAWAAAAVAMPGDPARIASEACSGRWAMPVLRALRDARRGEWLPPVAAVMLAAQEAPQPVGGVFAMKVTGTGEVGGTIFLNSELDYRDQRCLTVEFTPAAVAAYRARHGVDPARDLGGKLIAVAGFAERVRIDFMSHGMPTGAFYYQTHVVVDDPGEVSAVDPEAAPEPAPPVEPASVGV